MLVVSTQPFNAMGIISAETGRIFEINDMTTIRQLQLMGFIEPVETKKEKKARK